MALQRVHSQWAEHRRRGGERPLEHFDEPARRSWYPFQLAFILLNLPSVTDLKHPERSHPTQAVCDLLWFPTGGGKTEAYLGLAAYVLALRRLQPRLGGLRADAGVAVLMRYTLRVLTLQQFQRASALICACEVLRREDSARWGDEPFRIGLWVGQATAPNRVDIAAEALKNLHGDGWSRTGGRPDQLSSCPWCGVAIEPGRDMRVETLEQGRCRVLTFCGDGLGGCDFSQRKSPSEGLPVITVDEEIYRRLPALLIATVDKFAQLPWKGETQTLFGVVNGRCERHGFRSPELADSDSHPAKGSLPATRTVERDQALRPPDLVIQDELHLISGPLGTMVGHYETAIDRLMTWDLDGVAVRPKVVASTATIRRARQQIHHIFLREVRVFPPPSLDAEDSFFARERPLSDDDAGRLYLGVCAPGRRLKAVMIRVYVAFLAAGQTLYQRYGAAADPWMTLVGYFNAMQELAGMRRLCEDDIRTRLGKTDRRGLAKRSLGPYSIEELTSRLAAGDIPDRLDHLEQEFDPAEEQKRKSGRKGARRPIDVLLATSMISVGVDVQRLGLMVVAGQPKTSAEYIQATSRVGRSRPGVVCTVYNWARPRDLSHYERFEHYHATYYAQVEPLSVTPFSKRAMDRGLSALLVALVRLAGLDLNPNASAQLLDRQNEVCRAAVEEIVRRAGEVTSDSVTQDLVREMLEQRLDEWLARAGQAVKTGSLLGYDERRDSSTVGLLDRPAPGDWHLFTVLNSLRDVEPTVGLVLQEGALYPGGDGI
jgi:Helicase conserved C-terminal domain